MFRPALFSTADEFVWVILKFHLFRLSAGCDKRLTGKYRNKMVTVSGHTDPTLCSDLACSTHIILTNTIFKLTQGGIIIYPTSYGISDSVAATEGGGGLKDPHRISRKESLKTPYMCVK